MSNTATVATATAPVQDSNLILSEQVTNGFQTLLRNIISSGADKVNARIEELATMEEEERLEAIYKIFGCTPDDTLKIKKNAPKAAKEKDAANGKAPAKARKTAPKSIPIPFIGQPYDPTKCNQLVAGTYSQCQGARVDGTDCCAKCNKYLTNKPSKYGTIFDRLKQWNKKLSPEILESLKPNPKTYSNRYNFLPPNATKLPPAIYWTSILKKAEIPFDEAMDYITGILGAELVENYRKMLEYSPKKKEKKDKPKVEKTKTKKVSDRPTIDEDDEDDKDETQSVATSTADSVVDENRPECDDGIQIADDDDYDLDHLPNVEPKFPIGKIVELQIPTKDGMKTATGTIKSFEYEGNTVLYEVDIDTTKKDGKPSKMTRTNVPENDLCAKMSVIVFDDVTYVIDATAYRNKTETSAYKWISGTKKSIKYESEPCGIATFDENGHVDFMLFKNDEDYEDDC